MDCALPGSTATPAADTSLLIPQLARTSPYKPLTLTQIPRLCRYSPAQACLETLFVCRPHTSH